MEERISSHASHSWRVFYEQCVRDLPANTQTIQARGMFCCVSCIGYRSNLSHPPEISVHPLVSDQSCILEYSITLTEAHSKCSFVSLELNKEAQESDPAQHLLGFPFY